MSGMRFYLMGIFLYSGFTVGVSFAIANANTVGWDTLSKGWHVIYYIEAVLFALHFLILLLCWANNSFNQKILIFGVVLFTYKTALDPYTTMFMLTKDRGVYNLYAPFIFLIIMFGLVLHILVLTKWIRGLKEEDNSKKIRKSKARIWIPALFVLVTLTTVIVRNGLLGNLELISGLFIFTFIYIALLIGVCEFIIAAYCIFRFPSFSVNAPPEKKIQYVNKKKKRKKKKR